MTHTYLFRFLFFPHQFVTFRDGSTITTHVLIHGRMIQPTLTMKTYTLKTERPQLERLIDATSWQLSRK